ncbi:2-amino-4-hydroxy-6-hydroxymethyldihydropteridine pyrophosphokinase [Bacteroidia bacterium]|nr:2-amino-4-hydroxy-6-hydroxymethyldihydropteridine pyrophosphokinase [Bacteroidia bacterium]
MRRKHTVFLALGTNLGDKNLNLLTAIARIAERIGIFSAISSVYETEPWGFESAHSFFNMAVKIETDLAPLDLLKVTQDIEKEMGRTIKSRHGLSAPDYQDRIIDIDIILYDDLVYESEELTLPHPFYKERSFVMEPLKEITSGIV